MRKKRNEPHPNWPPNIHPVNGNLTRIDPTVEIYPLYTTNAITQSLKTANLNDILGAKEDVDSLHL